jgi:serine protease AprX
MKKIIVCLSLIFVTAIVVAQEKIEPVLLANANHGNEVEALVFLRAQADVSAANRLETKEEKGAFVFQTLQQKAKNTQSQLLAFCEKESVKYISFSIVNAIYVKTTIDKIRQIADFQEVAIVANNPWKHFEGAILSEKNSAEARVEIEWNIAQINANKVWAMGIEGKGVVVGGQDTGYQWDHPTLKKAYKGTLNDTTFNHNYAWHDAIHDKSPLSKDSLNPCGFDAKAPCDDHSHGTHTMGTMVGDDGLGNQIGVAPKATWVACRNMERGNGSPATYLEGFEWFLAPTDLNNKNPDPKRAPHVINNSWYCSAGEGCNSSAITAMMEIAVNNLKAAGVVVVVSAGNDGPNCATVSEVPGSYESGFGVGATDINDVIASFSSRGPKVFGNWLVPYIKPNVVAPGVNIRSCTPNNGFGAGWNGTSMAGPHVAGTVALVIAANPKLAGKVEIIENILETTAVPLKTTETCGGLKQDTVPNFTYGYGRIDALAAVKKAQQWSATSLIESENEAIVKVFPNPTTDVLNVATQRFGNRVTINIYDNNGRNILTTVSNTIQTSINVAHLPMSVYYYEIIVEGKRTIGKFIKI